MAAVVVKTIDDVILDAYYDACYRQRNPMKVWAQADDENEPGSKNTKVTIRFKTLTDHQYVLTVLTNQSIETLKTL